MDSCHEFHQIYNTATTQNYKRQKQQYNNTFIDIFTVGLHQSESIFMAYSCCLLST